MATLLPINNNENNNNTTKTFVDVNKQTLLVHEYKENNGYIQTFNKLQQPTAYVGTNKDMDGILVLNDRYGELGWSRSAKQ